MSVEELQSQMNVHYLAMRRILKQSANLRPFSAEAQNASKEYSQHADKFYELEVQWCEQKGINPPNRYSV